MIRCDIRCLDFGDENPHTCFDEEDIYIAEMDNVEPFAFEDVSPYMAAIDEAAYLEILPLIYSGKA